MHYRRQRLYGDPLLTGMKTVEERLLAKIHKTDGCWMWTGGRSVYGYGLIHIGGRAGGQEVNAHRVAYETWVGPIPEGLHIDHLCHNADRTCMGGITCPHRLCVNPAHLEPVRPAVNTARGRTGKIYRTHCPQGHAYSEPDANGRRWCRECNRLRTSKWRMHNPVR